MGGVVKAVKKVTKEVERGVKKAYDITNKLLIKPALLPTRWAIALGKVVIRGKSFKKTFAKELQKAAETLADIYDIVGNKWLGINDERFLGIKDKNLRILGKVIKDVLHDDAVQTLGFGLVALSIAITIFSGIDTTTATAAVVSSASITAGSTFATLGVWYVSLTVATIGMSFLFSAIVDATAMAIYGSEIAQGLKDYESTQEALRISNLNDILSGSIFDKMAGGYLYASQFAGNIYYDATTPGNCNISVGGEFNLSPHCIAINIGYIDSTLKNLAGDDGFSVVSMKSDLKI